MSDAEKKAAVTKFPLVHAGLADVPALIAIVRRLTIVHSVSEIMEVVTQAARTLLAADGITFVLRDHDRCYYAEEDAISPLWKGSRFPMSACISGWVMMERQAVIIGDITLDPRIPQDAYRPTFVVSLAMVPVCQDDPLAAIGAYWATAHEATQDELELLQTIANAAGLALMKVDFQQRLERKRVAQREIDHRLKNVLSVVDAMSRQTLRSTSTSEEFTQAFSGRLQALARAQSLLNESGMVEADLRALIREQLLIGAPEHRCVLDGPDVQLAPEQAFDLGLLLHELGTNARKYGSLSTEAGILRLTWHKRQENGRAFLDLRWAEEGGPPVVTPAVGGFGTTLLRHAFRANGGACNCRYEPTGVVCTILVPLS